MADTYLHVSGIPAISADALVDLNRRTLRAVKEKRGGDQDAVVVDNSTAAVTTAARAAVASSTTRVVAAGGAAGDITVAGMTAVKVIAAVVAIKDADQTSLDLTAEFTAGAGKINNTGGTATTGYHLVVVFYS